MFKLPDLPYAQDALAPTISAQTVALHHGKHHAKYVGTVNELLANSGESPSSLEALVRATARDPGARKLFNNAAQAWNHTFFWTCMAPRSGRPEGELAGAIERAFGDAVKLKAKFVAEGAAHFGSGWVWLAADGPVLKVLTTHDADDVLPHAGLTPILVCDLWEHAYYLDHQNKRDGFLEAWFDHLVNWRFAEAQYRAALGREAGWKHPAPEREAGTRREAPRSPSADIR